MNLPTGQYQSYLLRLWRPDEQSAWRITLELVGSGERQSFSDLERLLTFLKDRMGPSCASINRTIVSSDL